MASRATGHSPAHAALSATAFSCRKACGCALAKMVGSWVVGHDSVMATKPGLRIAVVVGVTTAALAACSASSDRPAARETGQIRRLENVIGAYAGTHAAGVELGRPAACQDRVIGQTRSSNSHLVYVELLCQGGDGGPAKCAGDGDESALGPGVASLQGSEVVGLDVDQQDDAAYNNWIKRHFPPEWQHIETHGPQYGKLLQPRLTHFQRHSGC